MESPSRRLWRRELMVQNRTTVQVLTRSPRASSPLTLVCTSTDTLLIRLDWYRSGSRPGAGLFAIDKVCRDIIDDAGYGEYFVHSTGHGVGLDVHERPYSASRTDKSKTIDVGQTLTIEPGIYVPGLSGARIENTLVVTEDGSRPLNTSSPALTVV